ncbi:hypothetical protein AAZX31_03G022800 [Glycine max]
MDTIKSQIRRVSTLNIAYIERRSGAADQESEVSNAYEGRRAC